MVCWFVYSIVFYSRTPAVQEGPESLLLLPDAHPGLLLARRSQEGFKLTELCDT